MAILRFSLRDKVFHEIAMSAKSHGTVCLTVTVVVSPAVGVRQLLYRWQVAAFESCSLASTAV